jgi:hypothetical protein
MSLSCCAIRRAFFAMLVPAWVLGTQLAQAEDATGLTEFVETYRCAVLGRLQSLYKITDPALNDHRYIVVAREDAVQSYAQCIFIENATRMLCEAASGYYYTSPNEPRAVVFPDTAKAALASLGFDTSEQQGNYQRFIGIQGPQDLGAVADLILTTLYRGYGARTNSEISLSAAVGPAIKKLQSCTPTS